MARKKKNDWVIDEWDESLDTGHTQKVPDPFGMPNSPPADDWGWPDDTTGASKGKPPRKPIPKWLIPAVLCLIILIILLIVLLPAGNRNETQSPVNSPTVSPTSAPTIITTASPTTAPTVSPTLPSTLPPTAPPTTPPTASPTAIPTASPTPSPTATPAISMLDQNEWYEKDLRYCYHQLSENEKLLYQQLYEGMMQFQHQIRTTYYTDAELDHVLHVLHCDTPELFQWDGSCTFSMAYFTPAYRLTQAEYENICAHIHGIVNDLSQIIPAGADEFEKEFLINTYLVDHCLYLAAGDSSTAYADASLYTGKSQCSGYSRGFMLLLRSFGITCTSVSSNSHEWNIVRINGQWYQADSTWNDLEVDGKPGGNRYFGWLNVPDRLVNDPDHVMNPVPGFTFPQCNSLQDNYAVRQGVYIGPGTTDPARELITRLESARLAGKDSVIVLIDDPAAVSDWDRIRDRFYSQYNGYGWTFYSPNDTQTAFAIWDGS